MNNCSQDPQWVLNGGLCCFVLSTHIKVTLITDNITELVWILLYIFHILFYLNLSLSRSPRLICAPVSLKGGSLRPKAVGKLPGIVVWLHCTNRMPVGWWDRSRRRSGLQGMCGIGRSVKWLLTHVREPSMGCWLALCTVTVAEGLIFTLFGVDTGAGFLLSHGVAGLSHFGPENENK